MNIVIDVRNLNQSQKTGVGEYTFEFLNQCVDQDKENNYFLFLNNFKKDENLLRFLSSKKAKLIYSRWPNKILNFCLYFKIIKLDKFIKKRIKEKDFKIDYIFLPNINFVNFSKDTKIILMIHDLSFEIMPYFFCLKRRLWHKLLNPKKQCQKATKIICPSKNTLEDLLEIYKIDSEKILVNPLGLSKDFLSANNFDKKEEFKKKYDLPENFILYLGTIEPRKNILSLIVAYEKSALCKKGYNLVLAGALGWKNKKIFKKINSNPNIKYIGYVKDEDKKNLYSLAKIFVYPSFYEGFGLPVLEAMQSKLALITSNNSSLGELVSDTALLINPNNVFELQSSMEFLLEKKDFRKSISQKAYLRSKDFSYKNHLDAFLNFI